MSWDIVLFNSKEKIESIESITENQLEPTNFCSVLESSFTNVIKDEDHREIEGNDFTISFFTDEEEVSNKMLSLYGENGLFELIELSKKFGWQIFDTGIDEMIDLENPARNGYENHKKYVEQLMKK
jgi:hypothetical protein